ncbi:DUF3951 domain-containing protein [Paenibacillus sp. NPDC057967]|uniref:DUF3951 domain-containing protein n=1 Tax=Paenibacillus sp. NPDC057967 TaxID=3346293 RepID=UPI0036DC2A75
MNFVLYMSIGVCGIFFLSLAFVIGKMLIKKGLPSNNYTPFDYISAHSHVEFHDEKQEKEENEDQGDDKNKNIISLSKRSSRP